MRKAPQLGGIASAWLARLPGTDRRIPTPREAAIAWAELAGLCALALAQPILDRLSTAGVGEVFSVFGIRGTEIVLHAFGGDADLIGKPAASLGPGAEPLGIALEDPEALADVDTGAAELPPFVTGALLDFNHPPGSPVAVVLNGRVAATARAFAAHFATMLPDAMFRDGANTLEVYDLSG